MKKRLFYTLLSATLVLTACESDTIGGTGDEPDVAAMRITIGGQQITIDDDGVSGGPISIDAGTATSVSAVFLKPNGSTEPLVTAASYQLNVTGATFQRSTTNPFAGTITLGSSGSVSFSLYNIETQETVFGPRSVAVAAE
jgi:hypothetical protein